MIRPELKASDEELADFCRHNAIRKLSFFGSVLREDFDAESDVDILVEFCPGAKVSLLDMSRMQRELTVLLGRQVDLFTPGCLSPYIKDEVLSVAQVQYAGT